MKTIVIIGIALFLFLGTFYSFDNTMTFLGKLGVKVFEILEIVKVDSKPIIKDLKARFNESKVG
jgi:hypothetical protein|tara:strand:+ start:901 stop:1092 length:192 start_codon:yes stop_codon:yes gene_type:complete